MKLLIEHSGTEYYNALCQDVEDLLEYEFGIESECMIGESTDPITIYTEDGKKIVEFTSLPSTEALRLYISLAT